MTATDTDTAADAAVVDDNVHVDYAMMYIS
jgi:hypothetical protein